MLLPRAILAKVRTGEVGVAFRRWTKPTVKAGGFRVTSRGITASPYGDTVVIVRNSRGVQVGDHNVQHNLFRIRVTDITVNADRLGMTAQREALISRLRENPDPTPSLNDWHQDLIFDRPLFCPLNWRV